MLIFSFFLLLFVQCPCRRYTINFAPDLMWARVTSCRGCGCCDDRRRHHLQHFLFQIAAAALAATRLLLLWLFISGLFLSSSSSLIGARSRCKRNDHLHARRNAETLLTHGIDGSFNGLFGWRGGDGALHSFGLLFALLGHFSLDFLIGDPHGGTMSATLDWNILLLVGQLLGRTLLLL